MNTNKYKYANKKKFQVAYGFEHGKWNFRIGDFTLLTRCPNGKKTAERVAKILRDSWLRHGQIDGAARVSINNLINKDFHPLKTYRGPWDHGFSWNEAIDLTPAEPSVKLISPELVIG